MKAHLWITVFFISMGLFTVSASSYVINSIGAALTAIESIENMRSLSELVFEEKIAPEIDKAIHELKDHFHHGIYEVLNAVLINDYKQVCLFPK